MARWAKTVLRAFCCAIVLAGVACHASLRRKESRVIGDITGAGDVMEVIGAPNQVEVGQPFDVTVTTFGSSCIRAERGDVEIIGLIALITPYDIHSNSTCMEYLRPYSRIVKVRFDAVGIGVLRVKGRNGNGELVTRERNVIVAPLLSSSDETRAQLIQKLKVRALQGCWKIDVGKFKVSAKIPVDPGQTNLPEFIQFDTLPGRSIFGQPMDFLVVGLPRNNKTRYHDGVFKVTADSVRVDWSNSVVGMTLRFPYDTRRMDGTAEAWTDYAGGERALIELQRSECPSEFAQRTLPRALTLQLPSTLPPRPYQTSSWRFTVGQT